MAWWEVQQERQHGGMIYGKARTVGDRFEAPETAMAFDEAEGIVERVDGPDAKPTPKKVAKSDGADAGKTGADASSASKSAA